MAIDPLEEDLISLSEAAKLLPIRPGGKRPHIATLYRWTSRGVRGVVLESTQCGGTRATSKEAIRRFCERLTSPDAPESAESVAARSRRREKEHEAAERACEEAGL